MTTLPHPVAADRILPGVALMLVFCVLAPLLDVSAKLAAEAGVPIATITTARMVVQGALMVPVMLVMRLDWRVDRRMAAMIVARAVFLMLSTYSFVSGIAVMPVADALAIAFVEPFILLILGHLIFGDQVGPRRIGACAVGFAGALFVIQPSLAVFGWVALWPLATAFFFAGFMLITRAMAATLHPVTMQTHTSIAGAAICLPLLWLFDGSGIAGLDHAWPQGIAWLWLVGVGFWAAVAHICLTYALKFAPSATLAPLHYFEIVVAVALGFAVFGDWPNPLTWLGISIIVASGLYLIHRERIMARDRRISAEAPR
jgi:drug/metabolite transporter (DMT)-like permease